MRAELHRFGVQEGHLAIFRGDQVGGIASFPFRSGSSRTPIFYPRSFTSPGHAGNESVKDPG